MLIAIPAARCPILAPLRSQAPYDARNEARGGEGAAAVEARHLSPPLGNDPFFECVARLGLVHPPRTHGFHSGGNRGSQHMSADVVDLQGLDFLVASGLPLCRLW